MHITGKGKSQYVENMQSSLFFRTRLKSLKKFICSPGRVVMKKEKKRKKGGLKKKGGDRHRASCDLKDNRKRT